jgi:hypothetical protein
MVEQYARTVEEHVRKVILAHQSNWNERLPVSSCWSSEHQPMRPHARRPPAWCSGGSYVCPVTYYLGVPLTRRSLQPTTSRTSRIDCIISTISPTNIWRRPVIGWRPAITTWLIPWDSRKEIRAGCIARSGPEGSCLSNSHHRKAHTRPSPRPTTWNSRSSNIWGQRWWLYTWTDWCHTYGLLWTSSLKEGAVSQAPLPCYNGAAGLVLRPHSPSPCSRSLSRLRNCITRKRRFWSQITWWTVQEKLLSSTEHWNSCGSYRRRSCSVGSGVLKWQVTHWEVFSQWSAQQQNQSWEQCITTWKRTVTSRLWGLWLVECQILIHGRINCHSIK